MNDCKQDGKIDLIVELQSETRDDVKLLIKEVAGLKVKASIWGGLSGLIVTIGAIIISLYSKKL